MNLSFIGRIFVFHFAIAACLACSQSMADQQKTLAGKSKVDFAHEILPILTKHCIECHAGANRSGGLSLGTRAALLSGAESGEVVVPGDAEASRLIHVVESTEEYEQMPPEGPRLKPEEIAALRRWIDQDLPWDAGVTLGEAEWTPPLQPRMVELPSAWRGREHPVDRLLDAGIVSREQTPPSPASDAAFLRRVTLDAIGLLPTPEELAEFTVDPSENKREQKIDELLARDVAYADHWLTMWNDLLRNDYTGTGYITGGRKQITPWLYASLKNNKPYDEFVRELIAPTAESSGFIDGIQWRGDVNASQTREIQFAQNISQVFLGINMKCASCHDSFIDRWTLSEAYNLAAIYADSPLELNRCDKPTGQMATPRWIFPELGDVDPEASKQERLQQLAGLMTHPDNGRFTRTIVNRIWERLMGRGIVHPVDAMNSQPWNEDLLDYLAVRFAKDGYDLRKFIRFVMTSQAYQSESVVQLHEPDESYVYAGPIARRMTAEQLIDAVWQVTHTQPVESEADVDRSREVPAQVSQQETVDSTPVVASWIWHGGETGKQTFLRKTVTLDSAPFAARLIATCDNAFKLRINGVEVASSRNWKQPQYVDVTSHLVKGDNLIEVDAEMFGGSAGFVGQIALQNEAGLQVIASDESWDARPSADSGWASAAVLKPHGAAPWGTVLKSGVSSAPPVRAALVKNDFLMRSLGRPHRDQVVTSRPSGLTTLQAIDLSNGEILAEYLERGGKRLASNGLSGERLAERLFLYALSRKPVEAEWQVVKDVLAGRNDAQAVEDLLWIIFMHPEFQMIR